MGGYGSTRWGYHSKKETVEGCIKLDAVRVLPAAETISNGKLAWDVITWSTGGRIFAAISYYMDYVPVPTICFAYGIASGEGLTERVRLTAMYPFHDKPRYWFTCPSCDRRCRCLYKPTSRRRFACLKCHDLSYNDRQEGHITRSLEPGIPGVSLLFKARRLERRLARCQYKGKRYRQVLMRYVSLFGHQEY